MWTFSLLNTFIKDSVFSSAYIFGIVVKYYEMSVIIHMHVYVFYFVSWLHKSVLFQCPTDFVTIAL